MNRREFMKRSGLIGAAVAAGGVAGMAGAKDAVRRMPTIKLGSLEVSRLILGSNPFWGYSHKSPQLDEEMKKYHTDERIIAILDEAAECGITAIASPPDKRWRDLYKKYLDGGGKLRIWIAQPHGSPDQMKDEISAAADAGAQAAFIQGARVEEQFGQKKLDVLLDWVEHIRKRGVVAGMAAHWPEIHPEIERRGFPTDFYFQCFYNASKGEKYRAEEREKAIVTIHQIKKPVIGYKILAAGRLPPQEGFEYAFAHLAPKDGVCVGVYTKDAVDQIRQNATLTESLAAL